MKRCKGALSFLVANDEIENAFIEIEIAFYTMRET